MFDPDGYLPVPHVVAWIAGLGAQGKLDRRLGFVHPGNATDALDLSAEATARFVLGEKLAGGGITAEAVIDPSGVRVPVPAYYWSGRSAAETMATGWLDLGALGFQNDLHIAHVILAIDKVAAALGFRFAPSEEPSAPPTNATPVYEWMVRYATEFVEKKGRPPGRNDEAVPDAGKAGFGIHKARSAYAQLPDHLKVPARKPRRSKAK